MKPGEEMQQNTTGPPLCSWNLASTTDFSRPTSLRVWHQRPESRHAASRQKAWAAIKYSVSKGSCHGLALWFLKQWAAEVLWVDHKGPYRNLSTGSANLHTSVSAVPGFTVLGPGGWTSITLCVPIWHFSSCVMGFFDPYPWAAGRLLLQHGHIHMWMLETQVPGLLLIRESLNQKEHSPVSELINSAEMLDWLELIGAMTVLLVGLANAAWIIVTQHCTMLCDFQF